MTDWAAPSLARPPALAKAAPYRLDSRKDAVLLRGLTAEELEGLAD